MKKLFFACFFVIGVSAVSFAQGGPGGGRPAQTPEAQLERLKTQITGITPDQETKLKAVYAAAAVRQDSLMKTMQGGDMSGMREKMAPLRAAQTAKIKAVLTADQQKAFDALPQGRGGFGGGQGGPPRN